MTWIVLGFSCWDRKRENRVVSQGPVGRRQTQSSSIHQHFLSYFNLYFWVCLCVLCVSPLHSLLCCSCCPLFWRLKLVPCTKKDQVYRCFLQNGGKKILPPFSWENFLFLSLFLSFLSHLLSTNQNYDGCTLQSFCVVSTLYCLILFGDFIPNRFGFPLQI